MLMIGNGWVFNPLIFVSQVHCVIAYGMGLTAENVAKKWNVLNKDRLILPCKAIFAHFSGRSKMGYTVPDN